MPRLLDSRLRLPCEVPSERRRVLRTVRAVCVTLGAVLAEEQGAILRGRLVASVANECQREQTGNEELFRSHSLSPHRQKAVNIHFAFRAQVNMPVYDRWNVESKSLAGLVARRILVAVVEFMSNVRGIAGV